MRVMQLIVFIQEKADGGSFRDCVISIAFVPYERNENSYAALLIALSITKVKVHMWHKRK